LSAIWTIPVYSAFEGRKIVIRSGEPPIKIDKDERLTKSLIKQRTPIKLKPSPLLEAMKYAEVLNEPSISTLAQVSARFRVSRARVSQMLNLLRLDDSIKKYLLNIEDPKEHNFFTERKLRLLTRLTKAAQFPAFRALLQEKPHKLFSD